MAALDWYLVENRTSIFVGGPVYSGRTTTLNYLSNFIKPDAKIVTIEYGFNPSEYEKIPPEFRDDVLSRPKLHPYHKNWVPFYAPIGPIGWDWDEPTISKPELLRRSIREKSDYIVVDDLHRDEAYTLFQAMATGHTSFATMHASDVSHVFEKLLSKEDMNVPRALISNLGLIKIQCFKEIEEFKLRTEEKLRQFETEEERQQNLEQITKDLYPKSQTGDITERTRRTLSTTEIIGIDPNTNDILCNELYSYNPREDTYSFSGRSYLLEKMSRRTRVSLEEIHEQIEKRKVVLEWMVQNGIRAYSEVVGVIQSFYSNPEDVYNEAIKS